jgi:branched-chain amino acid transport system permease protein
MKKFTIKQISVTGITLLLLLLFPLVITQTYLIHVMILVFMFGMLGVAWNIMGGYAGMFSFGQAAFFGIGAYTSSFLLVTFHVNPWIGLIAGGLVAALMAAAIGYPCSNLRGHYFAIATIAFGEIVRIHFNNWKLVNAAEGITIPMMDESLANFMFHSSKLPYYYIMLAFLLLALVICYFVANSKMGYYFRAIKESHDVAEVLGVNVVRYRLIAIMVSAFLSAMAGTFYAQYILYIDPESVMLLAISVQIVLISMLGGAGTIMGPVIGAAILLPISELTRIWLGHKGTGVDMLIYGFLITLISVYQPQGIWGLFANIGKKKNG